MHRIFYVIILFFFRKGLKKWMKILCNVFFVLDLITSFVMDIMLRSNYNSIHLVKIKEVNLMLLPLCIWNRLFFYLIDQPLKEWSFYKIEDFIQQLTLINCEIECRDDEVGTNVQLFHQVILTVRTLTVWCILIYITLILYLHSLI